MSPRIRAARPDDGPLLQEIERRAGLQFREVGMREIAEDDPPSLDVLTGYADAGRSWVAADDSDRPLGYVVVDVVDGCAHIEQVSVDPGAQRSGIGRGLLDHARAWATAEHLDAVTLTTFRDVPWNAPLYRHLGFRDLDQATLGPELRAVRDDEAAHGLDPATRVCMRAELDNR